MKFLLIYQDNNLGVHTLYGETKESILSQLNNELTCGKLHKIIFAGEAKESYSMKFCFQDY